MGLTTQSDRCSWSVPPQHTNLPQSGSEPNAGAETKLN